MSSFISNYLGTIVNPSAAFNRILEEKNYIKKSFVYILIPVVAYTAMYIFLTIAHGAPSVFTPWLNIPKESYYAVNRFMLAPSMILCLLVSASVVQIIGQLFNGKGTFEQSLVAISLSISVAMWGGLIHDLPMSFLSAVGVIDAKQHEIAMNSPTIFRILLWICYSVYFIAFLVLFSTSVRVVHGLSRAKSIFTGTLSFIVFQVIFLIFNR